MPILQRICLAALSVLIGTGIAGLASAHSSMDRDQTNDIAALAEQANLVFVGRVAEVEYRMSKPRSKAEVSLPHTIVTYEIRNVLRGDTGDKSFSMVFIGGADGQGRFLDVSGVPQFQPGEQDLLFVSGNGTEGCALVLCEWGRFRILEGGVYNTKGSPVRAFDNNRSVARGAPPKEFRTFRYPAPKFDELIKNPEVRRLMEARGESIDKLRERYQAEAPKQIEVYIDVSPAGTEKDGSQEVSKPTRVRRLQADVKQDPKSMRLSRADAKDAASVTLQRADPRAIATTPEGIPEGPMAIEEFTSTVSQMARRASRAPQTIRSFDRDAPIYAAAARFRAPQKVEASAPAAAKRLSREEAAEMKAAQERDFNPVLGSKK